MIFDTHAHYDDEQFDPDREELLAGMPAQGIGGVVNASATVASWDSVVALTEKYPFLYGMIGVHPDEVGDLNEEKFARMKEDVYKRQAGTGRNDVSLWHDRCSRSGAFVYLVSLVK